MSRKPDNKFELIVKTTVKRYCMPASSETTFGVVMVLVVVLRDALPLSLVLVQVVLVVKFFRVQVGAGLAAAVPQFVIVNA